jgi:hypothetical protein
MLTCGEEFQLLVMGLIAQTPYSSSEAIETCGCFDPVCDICDGYHHDDKPNRYRHDQWFGVDLWRSSGHF